MSPAEKFIANIFSFIADTINRKKRKPILLKALKKVALNTSYRSNDYRLF